MEFKLLLLLLAVFHKATAGYQCINDQLCDKISPINLDVDQSDSDLSLKWSYNSTINYYGFQVKIFDSDDAAIFKSPILHISSRSMDFEIELPAGQNYICLQVLNNSTHIIEQDCEDIKVSDLKIIVGILAGTIFLIPCLVILAVFMYKDKQIRNSDYQKLTFGHQNESFNSTEDLKAITKPSRKKQIIVHQPVLAVTTEKEHVDAHKVIEMIIEAPSAVPVETQQTAEQEKDSPLEQETVEEEKGTDLNLGQESIEADNDSAIEQPKIDETIPKQEPVVNVETIPNQEPVVNVENIPNQEPVVNVENIPKQEPVVNVENIPKQEPEVNVETTADNDCSVYNIHL